MNYRNEVKALMYDVIDDQKYVENWIGADGFFGCHYITDIIDELYFVTRDDFMDCVIYAARKVTPEGVETLNDEDDERALESLEDALKLIEEDVC